MGIQFSVVIPTFNAGAFVRRTLESIHSQDYKSFEVIIVDDHSTDDTLELVRLSGHPKQILTNPGKGVGAARNHGASIARGDYLCFLDADDIWFPWVLSNFAKCIESNENPPWVIGKSIPFTADIELDNPTRLTLHAAEHPVTFVYSNFLSTYRKYMEIHTGTHAIRRDVFTQCGGYDEHLGNLEDGDIYLKLSEVGPMVLIERPVLLGYRQREDSVSKLRKGQLDDCMTVYNRARSGFYASTSRSARQQSYVASRYLRPVLVDLARTGSRGIFLRYWLGILRTEIFLGHFKFVLGSLAVSMVTLWKGKFKSLSREGVIA
ncbi:MAG: glycosyltransferase family 2 protein [Puniceicoccaceae bacterium]